jgi:hypothetical protein
VYNKGLFASVVEDRDHQLAAVGQGPAHLDLAVAPLEATIQLEDSSRPRPAADQDPRTLAQLAVGRLRSLAVSLDAGEEKLRHLREPFDDRGGKRLRSCAVIFLIFSEPSLIWR